MENFQDYIKDELHASARIKTKMADTLCDVIHDAVQMVVRALQSQNKILICGNGGSAADSQHIAAELVGRFKIERKALPAIALTTDSSILTCLGNDYGFEDIFKRQVEALGNQGDALIAISTSGCSENILRAIEMAKSKRMTVISLVGGKTNPMEKVADITVAIPSSDTPRIQEGHITVGHILCDLVEKMMFS